jgi:hypothetical protein
MRYQKIKGLLIAVVLISSIFGNVLAQNHMPGVAVGNTFKYTYTFDSNIPQSISGFPELFQTLIDQAKSMDSAQITITQVSGTTVTMQMIMQFKNGTQQSSTGTTDVSTGQGNLTMFLIAANLNPNDQIYQGNNNEKINETITRTYSSGARQVNHENITLNYNVTQDELAVYGITSPIQQTNSQDTYWDKQTGSLVEMSYRMVTRSTLVNADISISVKLVESNVFTVPEYPEILLLLIALVVPTIVVIKFKNKLPKNTLFKHVFFYTFFSFLNYIQSKIKLMYIITSQKEILEK